MVLSLSYVLNQGLQSLQMVVPTPKLDAEILLAYLLDKDRSYLHAWPEKTISLQEYELYLTYIIRRKAREPIAYITGIKEFWSLPLMVSPDVLIPRPETELLVETVLSQLAQVPNAKIAELGTGSGAIALAIAHERPDWQIFATDVSESAIQMARRNAERLKLKQIQFYKGDWCLALPLQKYDAIISNPPYIDCAHRQDCDPELEFEPPNALFADQDGFSAYEQILNRALDYLKPSGAILFEHGAHQAEILSHLMQAVGLHSIKTLRDLANCPRVTIATKSGL